MGNCVCSGATLKCSFGDSTPSLLVLPLNMVNTTSNAAATIMDYIPMVNISAFGNCSSIANPMVVAATAAALGVLTPQPCIPMTVAPWTPGSPTVKIRNLNALDDASTLMCVWAGVIEASDPGQTDVSMDN